MIEISINYPLRNIITEMYHRIIKELDYRGIKTSFFIKTHKLSEAGFYGTISGKRKDVKTLKALEDEGILHLLVEEFNDFFAEFAERAQIAKEKKTSNADN